MSQRLLQASLVLWLLSTTLSFASTVDQKYGKLPLSFEPNRGQFSPDIQFAARGHGYSISLSDKSAIIALRTAPGREAQLTMSLINANKPASMQGEMLLPGTVNYFVGRDPEQWKTMIPTYGRVSLHDVYRGVDLSFYGHNGHLEYDFTVAPCATPSVIRFALSGAAKSRIDANGDLVLDVSGREVRWKKPILYQVTNDVRHDVIGKYVLNGDRAGFEVGPYDHSRPLVIDPSLYYSTYLGGSGSDAPVGIAVDSGGNAYVAGSTTSTNFPLKSAEQAKPGAIFVSKLSGNGTALIYSTYLGNETGNAVTGIAIDGSGHAYITGGASDGYPVTSGALFSGTTGVAPFVTKLSKDGAHLLYSTLLSTNDNSDVGYGIAVDGPGNAYITGIAGANFPTTAGAYKRTFSGLGDAFVVKLNPTGTQELYSTYLGASDFDIGRGIAIDSAGHAYIGGQTNSKNFPTTSGSFQPKCRLDFAGACTSSFVAKLNSTGSGLIYSTYLGGSLATNIQGITTDTSSHAYVYGTTTSKNFPTSSGAWSRTCPNATATDCQGVFVSKLSMAGSTLLYSTFIPHVSSGGGIAANSAGNVLLTGGTNDPNFATRQALQSSLHGVADAFLLELNTSGSGTVFATFLGGTDDLVGHNPDGGGEVRTGELGTGTAVRNGYLYAVGITASTNFPTTQSALQRHWGGGLNPNDFPPTDGFVTKIAP
jgi:hypothetical protein